jgi:hypothetical protein
MEMNMKNKVIGTILGVIGMLLWFMPFVYVEFMGMKAHQTGQHIGGIAYLLLISSIAYAVLSWLEQHTPRIIASIVATAICLLFAVQAGASIAWGLLGLMIISAMGVALAARDIKSVKSSST